jgi:hypothetical protein
MTHEHTFAVGVLLVPSLSLSVDCLGILPSLMYCECSCPLFLPPVPSGPFFIARVTVTVCCCLCQKHGFNLSGLKLGCKSQHCCILRINLVPIVWHICILFFEVSDDHLVTMLHVLASFRTQYLSWCNRPILWSWCCWLSWDNKRREDKKNGWFLLFLWFASELSQTDPRLSPHCDNAFQKNNSGWPYSSDNPTHGTWLNIIKKAWS